MVAFLSKLAGLIFVFLIAAFLMTMGALLQFKRDWPFFRDELGRQRFAFRRKRK